MALSREKIMGLIQNEVYSVLGVNVQNISEYAPEIELTDLDIFQGMLKYYTYCPYTTTATFDWLWMQTKKVFKYAPYKPSQSDEWGLIGISGEGRKQNLSSNLLDYRLTGLPISGMYIDSQQYAYTSTIFQQNIGAPEYQIDYVDETIIMVTGGDAMNSLRLAWMSDDVARIRPNHIIGVARLIGTTYYERILAMRGQINFSNTDFQMDLSIVESRARMLEQENEKFLQSIKKDTLLMGRFL